MLQSPVRTKHSVYILASSSRSVDADVEQVGVNQATVGTEEITNHTAQGSVRRQSKVQDDQVVNLPQNVVSI